MTLGERVYIYCERGTSEALWAEPINVISNAGFFLAALIFWQLLLWRPPEKRSADHYLFVALVFAICFGSIAFHVYADQASALADVIPIGVFMLVYLGFALNRFLTVPPGWTVFLVVLFAGLTAAATQIHCWDGGVGFASAAPDGAKVCMNGSVGYLPALGALIVVSMLLMERRHKAAPYVLAATLIFMVSILLRSLDMAYCSSIVVEGRDTGTHFIWHLLNALVLFLLMRASLETETKPSPEPAEEKAPTVQAVSEAEAKSEPEAKVEPEPEAKAEPEANAEAEAKPAPEVKEEPAAEPEEASSKAAKPEAEDASGAEAPKDEPSDEKSSEDHTSDEEPSKAGSAAKKRTKKAPF
jgi:hypothetical protein